MPVKFLSAKQIASYGHYVGEPTAMQLAKYFHLDDRDHTVISNLRRDHSRLGFALQLCTVRFLGCFVSDLTQIPSGVVTTIVEQLDMKPSNDWQ